MAQPKSILITGASSGLGAGLARGYANPGAVLFLHGRNTERLAAIAADCRESFADVHTVSIDIRDQEKIAVWVAAADDRTPLDLVIANAGISAGTADAQEGDVQTRAIFDTNLGGVMNTVLPVLPRMSARGSGQVAIMSSMASFFGIGGAPAYCASKAAARLWGEGLRDTYRGLVKISVICPGFVATPLTDLNPFPMPGLMSVDRAVKIIQTGLATDRARIAFPWSTYWVVRGLATLPDTAARGLLARFPRKPMAPD